MPGRIIKESICTSDNIDQLTAFQETFFYRLMVNCDDFGCMDARPKILASKLYPLKDLRSSQVEDALRALTSAELVTLYEVGGKPFLQMKTWDRHQRIRPESKHKYPTPEQADDKPQKSAANRGEPRPYKDSDKDLETDKDSYTFCPELGKTDSAPQDAAMSEFSIIMNDGKYYTVPQADIEKYAGLYPAVDIAQEMRKMIGWCESNPTKRKTHRGIKAFITNWLIRAQDRGPRPTHSEPQRSRFEDA